MNECLSKMFTIENITAFSVIISLVLGVINLYLLRKNNRSKQEAILFEIVTTNIDSAIQLLENLNVDNQNDSDSWSVATEQLSSFHNLILTITEAPLRRCYCGILHSFMLRIRNILNKIDDYKFFYGLNNYKERSTEELLNESYSSHCNVSVNALGCLVQFVTLFNGVKANYMYDNTEVNKILQPVYYGFKKGKDYTTEEIDSMHQPFRNIYRYANEWTTGVKKIHQNKHISKQ